MTAPVPKRGRPPPPTSRARTSTDRSPGSTSVVRGSPSIEASDRSSSSRRSTARHCHASVSGTAHRSTSASPSAAHHPSTVRSERRRCTARSRRSTSSANAPATATSLPSTTGWRATSPGPRRGPAAAMVEPTRSWSRPARHVWTSRSAGSPKASWSSGPRPQRTLVVSAHSLMRVSESASNPNRSRTGGRDAKAMTELARKRPSSRSSRAAAVSSTGLSCRRLRSATRTGMAGTPWWSSPAKTASISGAKRLGSGHSTATSRASKRGSPSGPSVSSKRWRSASRSTSTWRAGP